MVIKNVIAIIHQCQLQFNGSIFIYIMCCKKKRKEELRKNLPHCGAIKMNHQPFGWIKCN